MELLLKTVHGSRLYGLHHADSDYDTFEVYRDLRRSRQTVNGKDDRTKVSFDKFVTGVSKGVPQYLEALYSPLKEVDNLGVQLVPGRWTTVNTYLRTIKSFWRDDVSELKLRRHSARLALNLQDFMEFGYFNPVLTEEQKDWCEAYALAGQSYWRLQ